ncbi:MAG TPA: M48 family metalloprotease, partial [Blastocatellia bacterium]|nr:M48 family metalloprotease [Blastocatellia bacterium]
MHRAFKSVLTVLGVVLLLGLATPSMTLARLRSNADDQKKQKSSKKEEDDKPSRNQRIFLKIKAESQEWYKTDPEFRAEVDDAYRNLQRDHSEYAFYMNTHDQNDSQTTYAGDKLKIRDTLYDNPLVQDYVNRLGHSLVPAGSTHLYAFKVTMDPIPEARSLSTGTVYVSTGLISAADSEAQLAYVLGHEIAHVEKQHWLEDVMIERGRDRYNQKQEQKRNIIGGIGSLAAGPIARLAGAGAINALLTSELVQMGLPTLLKLAVPNAVFTWDKEQEDEADKLAVQYMLTRNYDPREVPRFYANLKLASTRDQRSSLGFMATASRVSERIQSINDQLGGLPAAQLTN